MSSKLLLLSLVPAAAATKIALASAEGSEGSVSLAKWEALVDPVMGGVSTGSYAATDFGGTLTGEVKDVPSLSAPGFVTAGLATTYPDASAAIGGSLELTVRSTMADYAGWRVSFAGGKRTSPGYSCAGGGGIPFSRGCYKADWQFPEDYNGDDFATITIPFTAFSDEWSSATGAHTKNCTEADQDVCPTAADLATISYVEIWAEGVDGKIDLDIAGVSAVGAETAEYAGLTILGANPRHTKRGADGHGIRKADVKPVDALDVAAYAGLWYQTYASLSVKDTFQLGGRCVTAEYAPASTAGHITVYVRCGSPRRASTRVLQVKNTVRLGGKLPIVIEGFAAQKPGGPGEFDVVLGPDASEQPYAESNYWIFGLGPVNATSGLYDYATVSDPTLRSLYVLARDVAYFEAEYEADVLADLAAMGFTDVINKPRKTSQEDCSSAVAAE